MATINDSQEGAAQQDFPLQSTQIAAKMVPKYTYSEHKVHTTELHDADLPSDSEN